MTSLTAAALPDERARRDPHGPCVADDHQELDNVRFADKVAEVAARLAAAGLNAGDVLAIMLPNRVELITSMFAAWRLGAAVTPINPALTAQEARYQASDAGAALIVADEASGAKLGDAGTILPVADLGAAPAAMATPVAATPDSLALLIYTSGTTGRPKGVMLDHANVTATGVRIVDWFGMDADTRCLLILPLFHVNGIMASVVSPLLAGGSTYVARRFEASTFWATVGTVRPTFFSAVPTMYAMLVAGGGSQLDAGTLRYVICAAGPMQRELISEFEGRYGVPLVEGYGLSECTVCCTANPVDGIRKPGTVGLAMPGIEVEVVDEKDRPLPIGEAGEVVVRGPNVMRGYLGRPDESAETLRGGWLHTGDVGRFDAAGYLTLVDRVKDLSPSARG